MKTPYNILFACLMSVFSEIIYAQLSDKNTFIINQYFKNTVSEIMPAVSSDLKNELALNYVKSKNNFLNISQIGNNNYVNVKVNANSQNIEQQGNRNGCEFISYYGKNYTNFEIQQFGNYNLIEVFGENAIINNLKIVQKSDFKRIIITNY